MNLIIHSSELSMGNIHDSSNSFLDKLYFIRFKMTELIIEISKQYRNDLSTNNSRLDSHT